MQIVRPLFAILAVSALFSLAGCSSVSVPVAGDYSVSQIDGSSVQTPQPIRVTYDGLRLIGKGPVNNWSVPVAEDGTLGLGISTKMAGAPELMQLESKLLKALDGGTLANGTGKTLVVNKDGNTVVVMQQTAPAATE